MKEKKKVTIAILIILIYLCLISLTIYKYVTTKDINSASLEITIMLAMSLIYYGYKLTKHKIILPKTLKGETLPTGLEKEDKDKRKNNYAKEALIFSILMILFELIAILFVKDTSALIMFENMKYVYVVIINLVITFIICYVISFGLDYAFNEFNIKRYNKNKKIKVVKKK